MYFNSMIVILYLYLKAVLCPLTVYFKNNAKNSIKMKKRINPNISLEIYLKY